MFEIGISELMVIAVVALIVIGPERLPRVARTVGHLLGRLQRYVNDVKSDINREIQLEELKKFQQQVAEQVSSIKETVSGEMNSVETSVKQALSPESTLASVPSVPDVETIAPTLDAPVAPDHGDGMSSPAVKA